MNENRGFVHATLFIVLVALSGACGLLGSSDRESLGNEVGASDGSIVPRVGFPFTDVTASSGVDFVHDNGASGRRHYPENMGPGVALFDADGDGDLDLYLVNGGVLEGGTQSASVNRLYRNDGRGRFEDVTAASGADDSGYGMGVAVGDIDGDRDLDLYVLNYGPNALYRNRGNGTFEKQTVGVEDPSWSVSGAFFDADRDGDLDLYVANYLVYDLEDAPECRAGTLTIYCSPEQFAAAGDTLYRNDGERFVSISDQAGVLVDGRGMGVVAADLNDDLEPDLYVTNDRSPNFLYDNEGGRLREVAAQSGVGYSPIGAAEGGMGVVAADLLASGGTSLFVTNFQKEANRLYVPSAGGFFDDLSLASGLGFPSMEMVGWGVGVFDLEGDGDLDLAVANGHVFDNAAEFIPGSSWELPDHLFVNEGHGNGSLAAPSRFNQADFPGERRSSRGLAAGDIDGDGDSDLVIASCGGPAQVWRNQAGDPSRFLLVRLRAHAPNTRAVGARVDVQTADGVRRHLVVGGGSYASVSDDRLAIGLGASELARLEVRWPDGSLETLVGQRGGREVIWQQGRGVVAERRLDLGTTIPEPAS